MNELQLFENPQFGKVRTLEEDGKILFCGVDVAKALGYSQPHKAIGRHCRYGTKRTVPHPQSPEKNMEMLFIPEGDVYRLTAKSELPGADVFESWIFDDVLPTIRKTGSYSIKPMTAYQEMIATTRRQNAAIKTATILNQIAHEYEGTTYKQVLQAHATKELTGEFLLPLPKLEAKTYSAKEIGDILGVSAHRVGVLANQHGLKNDQYGQWFKDKSPYGDKEVSTFRYYASAVEKMREVLAGE